jgi:hypothetical protein
VSYGYGESYPPTRYDYGQAEPVRRSAPASVHVVALILYLGGLALLAVGALMALLALGGGRYVDGRLGPAVPAVADGGLPTGAVLAFAGLVTLVIGRKVQRGRQWARVFVLMLSVLSIAVTLYNGLVVGRSTNALFGLVFPVMYVVLLDLPAARSWFRSHTY